MRPSRASQTNGQLMCSNLVSEAGEIGRTPDRQVGREQASGFWAGCGQAAFGTRSQKAVIKRSTSRLSIGQLNLSPKTDSPLSVQRSRLLPFAAGSARTVAHTPMDDRKGSKYESLDACPESQFPRLVIPTALSSVERTIAFLLVGSKTLISDQHKGSFWRAP